MLSWLRHFVVGSEVTLAHSAVCHGLRPSRAVLRSPGSREVWALRNLVRSQTPQSSWPPLSVSSELLDFLACKMQGRPQPAVNIK